MSARLCLIVGFALTLSSCAVTPRFPSTASGAATPAASPGLVVVVDDAAKQLAVWYPPGPTRWKLARPVQGEFGRLLVERLRRNGFAVQEYAKTRRPQAEGQGYELDYVFQRVDDRLHHLTVRVGTHRLSRAYFERDGHMTAAGAWTRGE